MVREMSTERSLAACLAFLIELEADAVPPSDGGPPLEIGRAHV